MTTSVESILRIQAKLNEINHELERLCGWTDAECRDSELGEHVGALKQHIDNAVGRASTVVFHLRRVAKQGGIGND